MQQPAPHEGSIKIIDPQSTPEALQAFAEIATAWRLSIDDQLTLLGAPPRSTYFKWRKDGGTLPKDTLERLSHLLSIYRSLQILLPTPQAADAWMTRPNKAFNGQTALQYALTSFHHLIEVRQYVDAQRGG